MRTTFGLVFSALFVSAVLSIQLPQQQPQAQLPISLLPGQSTIYTYSGRLVSGIAQSQTAALLEIKSDIILQAEDDGKVAMQMTNIRVGKHNGPAPDHLTGHIVVEHQEAPEYSQELAKPIRFIWAAGQVKSFEASASEPEWSVNIKKAILSLLNVNLHPQQVIKATEANQAVKYNGIHSSRQINFEQPQQMISYPIYEDGIGGICETLYEVKQSPYKWASELNQEASQQVLNVTKTRIYDNCLTRPVLEKSNVDARGAPVGCREGKSIPLVAGYYPMDAEQTTYGPCKSAEKKTEASSPMSQFSFARYNISKDIASGVARIESIYAEGKTILETGTEKSTVMVVVQQNVTLKTVQNFAERIRPVNSGIVHEELSFRLPKQPQQAQQYSSSESTSRPLDIPYFHLFGRVPTKELESLIPELLHSLAQDLAAGEDIATRNKNTLQKAVELSNAIAVLDVNTLEALFSKHAAAGRSSRATAHQQITRKLLLDLIGAAGSTECALVAVRLYSSDQLTTMEAKELFETIPQNLFLVDVQVVEQYLNLFLSEKVQQQRHLASSVGIALGKLVHEAAIKRAQTPGDLHTEEEIMERRRAQAYVDSNENVMYQNGAYLNQNQNERFEHQQQQQQKRTFRSQYMEQQQQKSANRIRRSTTPWEANFRQELLQEEQLSKIVSVLATALKTAPTFHQKVTLIESLAHMSVPEVLSILAPYVNEEAPESELPGYLVADRETLAEERNFLRTVTIYALAHVARQYPAQVLALLMPVYENKAEAYEVRIAAFTIALHCQPSRAQLERIASQLHSESNRQVRSFVTSALHTAANSTNPSQAGWEQFAADARLAVTLAPHKEPLGLHYSKMVGESYYHEPSQQGLNYLAEWVASNVSSVPRSAYFQLAASNKAMRNVLLEVGYNAKGIDGLVKKIFSASNGGIVADAFEAINTVSKDRRVLSKRSAVDATAQQALHSLKEKLNLVVRADDEPKATIFVKLFERTSYYALDRHYIHSAIDSAEDSLKDIASSLMAGKSYHYVKLVLPAQTYKVVPSELGLPVVLTTRHPTILSVKVIKAKLQLDMPKSEAAILPLGANLTVQIVPTLLRADYDFVFALAPATSEAIGTHIERTTRATFPVEVSAGFSWRNGQQQFAWSIVPTVPQEIFHHHVSAKTFISKAAIASSPDRDWLEEAVEIKSKNVPFAHEQSLLTSTLGMGVRVQVQSESASALRPLSARFLGALKAAKTVGPFAAVCEAVCEATSEVAPREVHIVLESDAEKQVHGYDFNIRYKRVEDVDGKVAMSREEIEQIAKAENEIDNAYENEDAAAMSSTTKRNAWTWAARAARQQRQSGNGAHEQLMSVSKAPTTEQVWEKIFNMPYARQSIKNVARELVSSTAPVWSAHWEQSEENKVRDAQNVPVPAIIAHDIVLTAIARSAARPTYFGANILLVKSFDERTYWTKVNAFTRKQSIGSPSWAKSAQHAHKELCFDGVLSYPTLPSEFYYEPSATQNLQAKMHAKIAFGVDCSVQSQSDSSSPLLSTITIDGLMEKTDEKVIKRSDLARSASSPSYSANKPEAWFYEQCAIDRAAGQPLSYACERAIIEDAYFKQIVLRIAYDNISPALKNATRKMALAAKVALYEHLHLNEALDEQPEAEQNKPKEIKITAQFSTKFATDRHQSTLANLYVQSPKENAFYEKVALPSMIRPLSALLPMRKVLANEMQAYESSDKCMLMESGAIRTFDNVTIKVKAQQQISQCQYLVAKDCSAAEQFAVFARNLDAEAKTKAITAFIGATEVRLLPPTKSSSAAQVVINGRPVTLRANGQQQVEVVSTKSSSNAKSVSEKDSIVLFLRAPRSQSAEPIVVVKAPAAQLTIYYDGKNVKIELAGRSYQGITCGLCGDNNDEAENEFTGPDSCVYQREADYIASYALAGQHCEQAPIPKGPKRCPAKVEKAEMPAYSPIVETKYGYVDLKEEARKAKAARSQTVQAQANAEELARLNNRQMEALINRSPVHGQAQFGGYPQYPAQKLPSTPAQQALVQRLRTYFVHQGADKVCFSIEPVLSCIEGVSHPAAFQQVQLSFHCLPANSISVQRLTMQAATSVLPQFGRKPVHYAQYVQVPTACVA